MTQVLPFQTKWEAIAYWSKIIRGIHRWSQDAVAANGGISKKTVQRIERGLSVDADSLRGLAQGLGEGPDYFEQPEWFDAIRQLFACMRDASEKVWLEDHPDHVILEAAVVDKGLRLCQLIDESEARLITCHEDTTSEGQDVAASLFDYVRDLGDILDEVSFVERRQYEQSLEELLSDLKDAGAKMVWALRPVTMGFKSVNGPAPWTVKALYLHVLPLDSAIEKLVVARDVAYG